MEHETDNNYSNNIRLGFCVDDDSSRSLKQQLLEGTIGPEKSDRRQTTDKYYGIAMIICVILNVILVFSTTSFSGISNFADFDGSGRFRRDHSSYNDLFDSEYRTSRVSKPDQAPSWDNFENTISSITGLFFAVISVCLLMCGIFVLLFRYATKVLVWGILILSLIFFLVLTTALWIAYSNISEQNSGGKVVCLIFAIASSILTFVIVCIFTCMYSRIPLVIQLFKEAMKAIFSMPSILFEPILTAVCLVGYIAFYVYISYRQVTGGTSKFLIYFNTFVLYWIVNFIMGCQHMVISGSIAAYFFARDKSLIRSPVSTSFFNVTRFHLGTVALGSLLITLAEMLKSCIKRGGICGLLLRCFCQAVINFIKYLTRNAYIYTAIHGKPFISSGKMVVKLLLSNIFNVAALNSVSSYVIFLAALIIVGMSAGFGYLIGLSYGTSEAIFTLCFALVVSILLCNCLFSVIMMSLDTIFLCFCEDSLINNGVDRPYLMSANLMQFIDKSQKIMGSKALQERT